MNEQWTDEQVGERVSEAYARAAFPREAIAARIESTLETRASEPVASLRWHRRHPVMPALLAAAAAITLFVAGAEYGRRTAPEPVQAAEGEAGTPLAIQESGTRYVADIARFAVLSPGLPRAEREEARQAAVAILYAAILALQEEEDEELLEAAEGLMHSLRRSQQQTASPGVVWF
jgi:hypothetical protein